MYDVVKLRVPLIELDLPVGIEGTVVMVHPAPPAPTESADYEVEFVTAGGVSVLATVPGDKLHVVWRETPKV